MPNGLRLGAPRHISAESFEFFEITRIYQFVIVEIGRQLLLHSESRLFGGFKVTHFYPSPRHFFARNRCNPILYRYLCIVRKSFVILIGGLFIE